MNKTSLKIKQTFPLPIAQLNIRFALIILKLAKATAQQLFIIIWKPHGKPLYPQMGQAKSLRNLNRKKAHIFSIY